MKTLRKLLSALLCLALLAGVLPFGAQPARAAGDESTAVSEWDGAENTDWYNETETSFTLTTAAQLAGLAQLVNSGNTFSGKTITLGADIDLNNQAWTPIGIYDSTGFAGTFDGGDHTISGLSINDGFYQGFFGVVGSSGTVQNLTIEGAVTTSTATCFGSVAGKNNGTIRDCKNQVSVTINTTEKELFVGGIAGVNYGFIESCINTQTIVIGKDAVGGRSDYSYVGGVVGNNMNNVINCNNIETATITASRDDADVGGIVGVNDGTTTGCTNSGNVTGEGSSVSVGGVVGVNDDTITGCTNSGDVIGKGSYAKVGGVVGDNDETTTDCTNSGDVTGEDPDAMTGGVVGDNTGTVCGCYTIGIVSGVTAGGVIGLSRFGTVSDCYWLDTASNLGIDNKGSTDVKNVESKTIDQFKSGEVAWLLQKAVGGDGPTATRVWGQQLSGETPDEYPVLTSDPDKKVYQVTFMNGGSTFATDYANSGDSVAFPKPDPTSENKEFTGWVDEGTEYTAPITVNGSDLIVHAWFVEKAPAKEEGYSINFTAETATADENYEISTDGTEFRDGPLTITPGGTLYVRYAGNTEKFTTNTIPARLAAPMLTISNEAEGAEISGAYYYSFTSAEYGNTDWKQGTGALVTVEPDDTIYIYKAATDEAFKSNVQTLTAPSRGAAPTLPTIDYGSETLSGTTAEMEYRVGANGEWKQCTDEDMSVTEWMGQTVYFRTAAANENYASDPVSLTIPARPVAPSVQGVNESIAGSNDGKITGLTAEIAYELSHDNGQTWTDVTAGSTEITGLEPGTYQVRIKAGTDRFASEAASVTIASDATPTPAPTPTPDPDPSGPSTGESDGWESIADEIAAADDGDSITIDMNGETEVPSDIFEDVAGKDVDLVFDMGDGLSWSVNGQDIPEGTNLTDLDLGVDLGTDGIPVDVINAITGEKDSVQITLAYDGDFGFTLTLTAPLGEDNAGYWANLYHYDEDTEAMNFEAAAEIGVDGSVSLPLSHASQYAIVIDDHSHAATDVSEIFTDVPANHWAQAAIQYVYDNGLMTGISDSEFAPEATTTRAMIVSMLARMENVTSAADAGFSDVAADDWYATAVNWAAANGIVNGISDDTFAPNDPITRDQLAAMLMNYAQWKGQDTSARADLSGYSDAPSTWASEAVQWAVAEGLLAGVTDDELQPQGQATRAHVAAIMQRFLEA